MTASGHRRALGSCGTASLFTKFNFFAWEYEQSRDKVAEVYYVESTMFHEWVHRVQLLASTFGRDLIFLTMVSGISVLKSVAAYAKANPSRLRRPLITGLVADERFGAGLDERAVVGLFSGVFLDALLGGRDVLGEDVGHVWLPSRFERPRHAACPVVEAGGARVRLGGLPVLEGHAWANELLLIVKKFGPACATLAYESVPVHPYLVADLFMKEQLDLDSFDPWLTRVVLDVALNGMSGGSDRVAWEDVHPGWRCVQIVGWLKGNRQWLDSASEAPNDLARAIRSGLGWLDPWEVEGGIADTGLPYLPQARAIRKTLGAGVSFCVENFETLSHAIPPSLGYPVLPKNVDDVFAHGPLGSLTESPEASFRAMLGLATVAESCQEILRSTTLQCPLHGQSVEVSGCVQDCEFEQWLHALIGMSVKEFYSIPMATAVE